MKQGVFPLTGHPRHDPVRAGPPTFETGVTFASITAKHKRGKVESRKNTLPRKGGCLFCWRKRVAFTAVARG